MMVTAEKLFKVLTGFVGMNLAFDDKNGEPDEAVMKVRNNVMKMVRHGVIATDFIVGMGLEKKYKKYEAKVNKDVAKIVERNQEGT
jgi:hypothetical protein